MKDLCQVCSNFKGCEYGGEGITGIIPSIKEVEEDDGLIIVECDWFQEYQRKEFGEAMMPNKGR